MRVFYRPAADPAPMKRWVLWHGCCFARGVGRGRYLLGAMSPLASWTLGALKTRCCAMDLAFRGPAREHAS